MRESGPWANGIQHTRCKERAVRGVPIRTSRGAGAGARVPSPREPWLRSPMTAVRAGLGLGAHAACLRCWVHSQGEGRRLMGSPHQGGPGTPQTQLQWSRRGVPSVCHTSSRSHLHLRRGCQDPSPYRDGSWPREDGQPWGAARGCGWLRCSSEPLPTLGRSIWAASVPKCAEGLLAGARAARLQLTWAG